MRDEKQSLIYNVYIFSRTASVKKQMAFETDEVCALH
jgi:hypothetical protein